MQDKNYNMTLYELQPGLPLTENYRAISRAQIDLAIDSLSSKKDVEKGVYAARKCMKRLRGLVQLYRGMMYDSDFEAINAHYRDIGRSLSDMRDAWVRIEVLDKLPENVRSLPIVALLRAYIKQEYEDKKQTFLQAEVYQPVVEALKKAKETVDTTETYRWFDLFSDGPEPSPFIDEMYLTVAKQMKATSRARRRARKAYRDFAQFSLKLHEWRKRVKRLWYALSLLRPVNPKLLDDWIKLLDDMGVLLGDANDYHVLHQVVSEMFSLSLTKSGRLPALRDVRQAESGEEAALYQQIILKLKELHQKLEFAPVDWLNSLPPEAIHAEARSIPKLLKWLKLEAFDLFKQVIEMERAFKCSHRPVDFRIELAFSIERTFPGEALM